MATEVKSAIAPMHTKTEPNANAIRFFDKQLARASASGVPGHFRGLSHFRSMRVLVPKLVVEHEPTQKKQAPIKSVTDLNHARNICLPRNAAKVWLKNVNDTDLFAF